MLKKEAFPITAKGAWTTAWLGKLAMILEGKNERVELHEKLCMNSVLMFLSKFTCIGLLSQFVMVDKYYRN